MDNVDDSLVVECNGMKVCAELTYEQRTAQLKQPPRENNLSTIIL